MVVSPNNFKNELNNHKRVKLRCADLQESRVELVEGGKSLLIIRFLLQLSTHLRKHEDSSSYSCTQCKLKFVSCENLRTHMKLHATKKDFQCHLCDKVFFLPVVIKLVMCPTTMLVQFFRPILDRTP
jgi:hypothetical protein